MVDSQDFQTALCLVHHKTFPTGCTQPRKNFFLGEFEPKRGQQIMAGFKGDAKKNFLFFCQNYWTGSGLWPLLCHTKDKLKHEP